MNAIKHLGCSVSKGVVTVRVECVTPQAARALFNAITVAEKSGMFYFDPAAHDHAPPLVPQRATS